MLNLIPVVTRHSMVSIMPLQDMRRPVLPGTIFHCPLHLWGMPALPTQLGTCEIQFFSRVSFFRVRPWQWGIVPGGIRRDRLLSCDAHALCALVPFPAGKRERMKGRYAHKVQRMMHRTWKGRCATCYDVGDASVLCHGVLLDAMHVSVKEYSYGRRRHFWYQF